MTNRFTKWSWRVYPVWAALLIGLLVMLVRLGQLQLIDEARGREFLQQQGDARVIRRESISASRGEIVDRNGELLAFSTPVKSLWVNPALVDRSDENIRALALALSMPVAMLNKRLQTKSQFVYLRRQLEPRVADEILARQFEGLFANIEYQRFYPAGEVASHLVGFTDVDDFGQEGMELSFDETLRGDSGEKQVMKDAHRRVIKDIKLIKAASDGERLDLSIDMRLQYAAYRELKAAVTNYKARSGSMVLLDVKTGEVLALVNQPSYNANNRSQMLPENMRNRALIDLFEPGSTVKPFTIAAALESGDFEASTIVNTSPGYIRVGKSTLVDPRDYGAIDLSTILRKSSQVGTIKIALDLDIDYMRELFARVGLGEYCATGFPGEQAGYLPHHRYWQPVERATLAYGHGLSVNTMQLARAYAVIANDGIKRPVSLLKISGLGNAGRNVGGYEDRVMSSSVARQIRNMMVGVIEKGGTGIEASIPGYSVAGKTGTAHKVGEFGYEENRYRATFAGMAPATNPRFVAVVTINDPRGEKYFGGEIAAPVFSRVMSAALRLMDVPPDRVKEFAKGEQSMTPATQTVDYRREQHGSV